MLRARTCSDVSPYSALAHISEILQERLNRANFHLALSATNESLRSLSHELARSNRRHGRSRVKQRQQRIPCDESRALPPTPAQNSLQAAPSSSKSPSPTASAP